MCGLDSHTNARSSACRLQHFRSSIASSAPPPALQLEYPPFPCLYPPALQRAKAFTTSSWLVTILPVPLLSPTYLFWALILAGWAGRAACQAVGEGWSQSCPSLWEGTKAEPLCFTKSPISTELAGRQCLCYFCAFAKFGRNWVQ